MTKATSSTSSRRTVLMGLAAAGAFSAPAIATAALPGVDPIFAAIKHERDAFAAYCVTNEAQSRISGQNPFPPTPEEMRDRKANARRMARPEQKAWWAACKEAEAAHTKAAQKWWSAREGFLQTQPTTVAGLLAYLDHIEGPLSSGEAGEAFWDDQERELAFPTLAASLRGLIA
jgi:hypothetical protein